MPAKRVNLLPAMKCTIYHCDHINHWACPQFLNNAINKKCEISLSQIYVKKKEV